ncbi:MAG TPA: ATP-dependent DNA helicase RecG [Acidimicrobiales bacterium]|nr:ATP-dependent DNA helicase RecG [Acidimicrobiales bacterium]
MTGKSLDSLARVDVGRLEGVGDKKRQTLADAGIDTVLDLLTHYPRRYLDRTAQKSVRDMAVGESATVLGVVKKVTARRTRNGRSLVDIDVFDGSAYLKCSFFNQPWRGKQLPTGSEVIVFGKLDLYRGVRQMVNPIVDPVGNRTGRIVPVYPQSEKAGLVTWDIARWVDEALVRLEGQGGLLDPLPKVWRDKLDLVGRMWAMQQIHHPESMGAMESARKRLAFDELLRLQTILVLRKRAVERDATGIRHQTEGELVGRFIERLPFPLTSAQRQAIAEIQADLAGPHPMHRLLQGDVGAGKTVVAVAALLSGVQGGYQGALMAPTEVLAEQHHLGVSALLAGLSVPEAASLLGERPVSVALLTNRTTASERGRLHAGLAAGTVDILIGTHALLTEAVSFAALGVVVIDEQHRFGVEQRAALRQKGAAGAVPDVLVMTATPIPRTAAMTVYGDLDTTVLGELPPGRTPVTTVWARGPLEEATAWERVREAVAAGQQAYVVCPLVDESERVQARSATDEFERLGREELAGLRLGLLHGQMPPRDKEAVMADFRSGAVDVLVATTVIEVGVDVPNATVMVIEDADRFGMAQLHQLRGRVGRGQVASWCYLLGAGQSEDTEKRLLAVAASTDGFELAEVDLELRGEGTILGTRQKGATDLKLASLRRDKDLVEAARTVAFDIVDGPGGASLEGHPDLAAEIRALVDEDDRNFLFKS